ncbi:multicopper oxidase family protein [Celeribacter halophilus]|uniref:Multicopper oxidase with three cupredoxin domains (Includes cell division protein FtsP and spore coat protein CotA) n=1 Tax=Celeribacter halophilus TaxID=576117 RepID=A0A1I3RQD8_9RHOB|nr:multicopper oxidase family protein [Celeribacter halophilus]PZX12729.1 FtsP/CotA-like multicopper oxidase with cupredoxin domain [Celeribacter halophilus]SFJ48804.1 Multicopper oxidase with three cupredoxin domains (includes cell division protein FtsP and spore coat protein CotA) [Celeribacter halophilus]
MTDLLMSRRHFLAGTGALGLMPCVSFAASPAALTAQIAHIQLAPDGYPVTEAYTYGSQFPGPMIRAKQGERIARELVNDLPVPTSVHWHGIRIDNAMDGVAGLTQEAVLPKARFTYDFAVPDAGTYWYHAHINSMEQVARGLYGPLIIDEVNAPDVDRDEVLMLDDWRLDPETAQIDPDFDFPMDRSHAGRYGNLIGTNGRYGYRLSARRGERLRLRLINAANARIFGLTFQGLTGWTVALDGMPLATPEPVDSEIVLAPAQRIDLIVDVTAAEGEEAMILRFDDDEKWRAQVGFDLSGIKAIRDTAPAPLPPNPGMETVNLARATQLEMRMEGGAMGNMPMGRMNGQMMGFREMVSGGMYWTLAGVAGMDETPFARLSLGEHVRLKLTNDTIFPHAMHLHGQHFREISDGKQGPMRDTLLSLPAETTEIAFVANNPGKWLFHCHMLGHAATGMTTWIEVA